jgi:hypothetical protein
MSNLEMRIYTSFNGIETTVTCRDESEFQAIKSFLQEKGVAVMGVARNGERTDGTYVYVETQEQIDALNEFVKLLRAKEE